MKVIVLAAGKGQRFRDKGFVVQKPLLRYKEVPIISRVLYQLEQEMVDIIVVGTREVAAFLKDTLPELDKIITVDVTQNGPAMSAVLASSYVTNDEQVFIVDCDVLFKDNTLTDFIELKLSSHEAASILTTIVARNIEPYCSIVTAGSKVTSIHEKMAGQFGRIAVGCYYFRHWKDFLAGAREVNLSKDSEVFISDVLKTIVSTSRLVTYTDIPIDAWIPLGTPEELMEAQDEGE